MKKATHLVDVPGSSSDASPLYFDELGEPVYVQTYTVQVNGINKNKHLIQLPISVNLEKVRKLVDGPCPTVLLKADTGADVKILNSTTFDQIIDDRSILQPSTLRMETYGSSRVEVLGKFNAFLRWKGKIFRQPLFVTTANSSPNLLSRDAYYTLGVVRPCYSVDQTDQLNLQAACLTDLQANLQGLHMADLQSNFQGSHVIELQENLQHNQPQIHSIEASNTVTKLSDVEPRQRLQSSMHFTAQSTQTQSTEIVNKKASAALNIGSRSTGKSAGYVRFTTKSTRSTGSTTQSATESTVTMMIKGRKQPPVDSITHTNFRTSFLESEMEMKQMRQIQDRCIHNNTFRQMRDPDLHMDLQPNLQEDPPTDLQADLQMDLQANLQVRTDLQPDL